MEADSVRRSVYHSACHYVCYRSVVCVTVCLSLCLSAYILSVYQLAGLAEHWSIVCNMSVNKLICIFYVCKCAFLQFYFVCKCLPAILYIWKLVYLQWCVYKCLSPILSVCNCLSSIICVLLCLYATIYVCKCAYLQVYLSVNMPICNVVSL